MRFRPFFLIFLITVFGFLTRAYKLDSSPAGLYIDEASIGYNAYSIVKTTRDEHGKFMPVFFKAFGEYKLPIYIYSVAIVQILLGPSDVSVRIPSLIFGTFSIPLIYFLAKELVFDFNNREIKSVTPLLSSLLLAVSPWHFQFSRPGFEASAGLFFLLLALLLFFQGIRKVSSIIMCLSLLSFVVTFYSYNSARIVSLSLLVILGALYLKNMGLKFFFKAGTFPLLAALPFIAFSLSPEGLVRAKQVWVFFGNYLPLNEIFHNYLKNISPLYLFINGDPTIAHMSLYRMPLLYPVEILGFFLGIFFLLKIRTKKSIFAITLLLISFFPPSIAILNPHALRGMLALSITPIISAIGFSYLLTYFKTEILRLFMLTIFIILIFISSYKFIHTYHNKYAVNAGWDWQVGIKGASLKVLGIEKKYQDIYFDVDPRVIPLAWYLKIDPQTYQESDNKSQFGKYHINEDVRSLHGLYIGLNNPRGRLLEYIYYPNKSIAYGIWEF